MYSGLVRRTQIYIDEGLDRELREVAAAQGRSAAAVIREALRAHLNRVPNEPAGADPILEMAGAFRGLPPDGAVGHDHDLYGAGPEPVPSSGRPPPR